MARSGFDNISCKKDTLSGLEKIINSIKKIVLGASFYLNDIIYGKALVKEQTAIGSQPSSVRKSKKPNPIDRALEKGLIEVLNDLSSVDFCNLLNYLVNSIGGGGFNPKERPSGGFALTVWNIQNEAYKLQLRIDKDLGEITGNLSPDATLRLTDLLGFISNSIRNKIAASISESQIQFQITSKGAVEFSDPEVEKYFKRLFYLQAILNTSADILESLGSNLTIASAQKAVNTINKLRAALILIQGLNNPAAALTFINQLSGGALQDQFAKINKLIPVQSLVPLLKKCIKICENVNSVGQKILGSLTTIQFFIKIATTVIKVLTIIRTFFLIQFQLPNLYTTVSATTTASNTVEQILNQKGIKKLVERLDQINSTLCIIINFVNTLLLTINQIIPALRAILLNIQSCNNIDDSLKQDLSNTIDNLTNTRNRLQDFINSVNSAANQVSNSFGEYTIEIVTEQVVDESINLKRRFGIARGKNNIIAVQSTPTFASLDLIIINEVKALLVSKGLVNVGLTGISVDDLAIISESITYLGDQSITLENLDSVSLETPEIEDDEDGDNLQLGSFVDNLPGGRRLRRKVRNKLIKNNEALIKNLKSSDPSSTGTQKIIKQKELETNKLKIQKLEDQKKDLQKLLLIPGTSPLVLAKIKDIDNQINKLKNNQK
jgi:hypothetical protein